MDGTLPREYRFMTTRMLIDATQQEEIRVAIVENNKLLEYDFEIASRKQIKGNIYLARVTRVEPSLQAAFIEYGGNRHGFLAFSEIHPDYYRIPIADREALLAAQAAIAREAEEEDLEYERRHAEAAARNEAPQETSNNDVVTAEIAPQDDLNDGNYHESGPVESEPDGLSAELAETDRVEGENEGAERKRRDNRDRNRNILRQYKIQEVTARRQIMLVQVTKEERGNKGAALTTYLSLAGRYCVLMPNSPRGGGVSRKITSHQDRRRMKELIQDLEVPPGMSVILRTAGVERTKAEIKRDLDYLLRQWDTIREMTLKSSAPALIYEEGNLIKRTIRDMYTRDIDEVQVSGEEGYRAAKELMRMLMPSHAKKVQPYRDADVPMFFRYQVESQIEAFHDPVVQLKSGGYIVINPTEALISVDVNSGKSTRERHIEETALRTNLEASSEVARQLRLRDLAGLVVIDFIDMEDPRNNAAVERKLKDALRLDRARIQVGRISSFGLLELSRQRLRPSLFETSFEPCVASRGTGYIRTIESSALQVLRHIHEESLRRRSDEIHVFVETAVALYLLNHKRAQITELELQYEIRIIIDRDDTLIRPDLRIDRVIPKQARAPLSPEEIAARQVIRPVIDDIIDDDDDLVDEAEEATENNQSSSENGPRRDHERSDRDRDPRRRRRRSGNRDRGDRNWSEDRPVAVASDAVIGDEENELVEGSEQNAATGQRRPDNRPEGDSEERFRRRRGRRGGRFRRRRDEGGRFDQDGNPVYQNTESSDSNQSNTPEFAPEISNDDIRQVQVVIEPVIDAVMVETVEPAARPARGRGRTRTAKATDDTVAETAVAGDEPAVKPTRTPRRRAPAKNAAAAVETAQIAIPQSAPALIGSAPTAAAESVRTEQPAARAAENVVMVDTITENKSRKGGWWQKIIG
jgi:ribonuclease E